MLIFSHNGAGSLQQDTIHSSPAIWTYYPAAADIGNTITITVTTDNPNGSPCVAPAATFKIEILPEIPVTHLSEQINAGDSAFFNGHWLYQTRSDTATFFSVNHCDSIVILQLYVDPPIIVTYNIEILALNEICANAEYFDVPLVLDGSAPDCVSVKFSNAALNAGFTDLMCEVLPANLLRIVLPTNVRPDYYSADLIFKYGNDSLTKHLNFIILYSPEVMQQKWNNVITLKNAAHNGGYIWSDYQWYLNNQELPSNVVRNSYIYMGENQTLAFGEKYRALLTREGETYSIFTCALIPEEHTDLTPYPVVVSGTNSITITKISKNSTIHLYTITGVMLQTARNYLSSEVSLNISHGAYVVEIIEETGGRISMQVVVK